MLGCRCIMGGDIVPSTSKISKTHVHCGRLVCQIFCKSAEKRYLEREKFEKIADFEKFQINGIKKTTIIMLLKTLLNGMTLIKHSTKIEKVIQNNTEHRIFIAKCETIFWSNTAFSHY